MRYLREAVLLFYSSSLASGDNTYHPCSIQIHNYSTDNNKRTCFYVVYQCLEFCVQTFFFFFAYIKRQFVLWWYLLFRINRFCLFGCPRDIYTKKYNPSGWKQLHVFLVWSRYFLGFAASWCTCLWTGDSIIRSDGKSLCKVLCIITYQNQDSHPQILWVTNSQQLRDFVSTQKKKKRKLKKKSETKNIFRAERHCRFIFGFIVKQKKNNFNYVCTKYVFRLAAIFISIII